MVCYGFHNPVLGSGMVCSGGVGLVPLRCGFHNYLAGRVLLSCSLVGFGKLRFS